jgi:hypothetical protein
MSNAQPPTGRRQRRLAQSQTDRARRQQAGSRGRGDDRGRRTRPGWLVLVGGGVSALVIVVVVLLLVTRHQAPSKPAHLALHTLLRAPAASAVVQRDGTAWETDDLRDLLVRFDPSDGHTLGSLKLPGRPVAMILRGGDIWVASMVSNTVEEISIRSMHIVRTVTVPPGPSDLVPFGGRIWVSSVVGGEVTALDPTTGASGPTVRVPAGAVRLAAGFGALWVTGTSDELSELRPGTGGAEVRVSAFKVGSGPIGVATGAGSVWVADASAGTVVRIDPQSHRLVHTYRTGGDPLTVAVAGGRVWVGDGTAETVRTVFPAPGLRPVSLGSSPRALLGVGDDVWIAAANPGRVLRAGASTA